MLTTKQLILYAVIGAIIAVIFMRAEDKFNNKQYTRTQYFQTAIAGFLITLIPIWLLHRSLTTSITTTQTAGNIYAPTANKPLISTNMSPTAPVASSDKVSSSIPGAFFTPIVNAVTPKMQYRTSGPTF